MYIKHIYYMLHTSQNCTVKKDCGIVYGIKFIHNNKICDWYLTMNIFDIQLRLRVSRLFFRFADEVSGERGLGSF